MKLQIGFAKQLPKLVFRLVVMLHVCQLPYPVQLIHQIPVLMYSPLASVASVTEIDFQSIVFTKVTICRLENMMLFYHWAVCMADETFILVCV